MQVFLFTLGLFGFIMLIMAVGVIFSGRCLRGSCGGSDEVIGPDGEPIRCATCPKRKKEEEARRQALLAARAEEDEDEEFIEPIATTRPRL